jgi:hypothetical protein
MWRGVVFNLFRGWISRRREREAERDTDGLTLEEAIPDAKLLIAFASAYTRKTEQALIADLVHATGKVIDLAAQKLPIRQGVRGPGKSGPDGVRPAPARRWCRMNTELSGAPGTVSLRSTPGSTLPGSQSRGLR